MRFVFIQLFALIVAGSSLYGINAPDFGISYAIPDGFTIQDRNPPSKAWPEIYMVQSKKTHPDAENPLDLSICAFNEKFSAMMMSVLGQKKEDFEKKIGSHTVFNFPGFPGPYGENAYFYIVPRGDGSSIGIHAPRFLSKRGVSLNERPPSGMDSIIEGLIATMKFESNATNK
jgi:hypothetical protein